MVDRVRWVCQVERGKEVSLLMDPGVTRENQDRPEHQDCLVYRVYVVTMGCQGYQVGEEAKDTQENQECLDYRVDLDDQEHEDLRDIQDLMEYQVWMLIFIFLFLLQKISLTISHVNITLCPDEMG